MTASHASGGFPQPLLSPRETRGSDARYRGLLEAAPDAMVVVNQSGDIVLLNVQAEKRFGYRRDELVGQPVKNIIPEGFAERLIADGERSAPEALAQQIGTGIELTGRRKDGSAFPIELMLSPLESAEGILVTAATTASTLQELRGGGVQIALDDFGTGYSSLSYLQKFPVDTLKIDQSFVREISTKGDNATLVTAVINMARSLNLKVIAEGVENAMEMAFLQANHCDQAQGYYFSKPVDAAQAERLLRKGRLFPVGSADSGKPGPAEWTETARLLRVS